MFERMMLFPLIYVLAGSTGGVRAEENSGESSVKEGHSGPKCVAVDNYFMDEVWTKVGERSCLKCHNADGDAADSRFLLRDPSLLQVASRKMAHASNRNAFAKMAALQENNESRLLLKVRGKLDHGGEEVLKVDSTGYRILARFVRSKSGEKQASSQSSMYAGYDPPPFFAGVTMLEPRRLLRRVTLSLAGRLPTPEEHSAVQERGLKALDSILDNVMQEDDFYARLTEGFNDIFLTLGYDGVPERVLGYRNFGGTRNWTQKYDLSHIEDEKERRQALYKLTGDYRASILREPLELIEYIVRQERPFTEIVMADYIMVSPYTARGYGIYEKLKDRFENPDDFMEFVPTRLEALTSRNGKPDQKTPTGFHGHSGMLTTFHWLKRYPTTETNRNRLRSRMYYQHFLGVDVLALAPRVTDAAAVDAEYEIPTMQAADCVVCHKTLDPVAGLFQDYYDTGATLDNGPYSPRKDGWFTDIFGPGFQGEDLPETERWRALQWLGERTAKDPRFAVAMIEHVYYILTGRKVLAPPQDIDDPLFASRRRAYQKQRDEITEITASFARENFNLKVAFKEVVFSPFYRADGLATVADHPRRRAELDDIGVVHLLSPEQLERKIEAIFGERWGRLEKHMQILYGGINSKSVTERIAEPGGAMGAIQRIMSNEVACKNVSADFALKPGERKLFPDIEPDVVPGKVSSDQQIRKAIVYLHQRLLGRIESVDAPEVERTYQLFAGILVDVKSKTENGQRIDLRENYHCRASRKDGPRTADPHYTLRAWRGVVTYLLRQEEFLYE
jgi:hypothetical protein